MLIMPIGFHVNDVEYLRHFACLREGLAALLMAMTHALEMLASTRATPLAISFHFAGLCVPMLIGASAPFRRSPMRVR